MCFLYRCFRKGKQGYGSNLNRFIQSEEEWELSLSSPVYVGSTYDTLKSCVAGHVLWFGSDTMLRFFWVAWCSKCSLLDRGIPT